MPRWPATIALTLTISSSALAAPPQLPARRVAFERVVHERFGDAARVRWDRLRNAPRVLRRLTVATVGRDASERALGFVRAHRDLIAPGGAELAVHKVTPRASGAVVQLAQRLGGLPVEGAWIAVTLDAAGAVRAVRTDGTPRTLHMPEAVIPAARAGQIVSDRFVVARTGAPTLVALPLPGGEAVAAWRVPAAVIPLASHFFVWVDAETGAVLRQAPAGKDQRQRRLEVRR